MRKKCTMLPNIQAIPNPIPTQGIFESISFDLYTLDFKRSATASVKSAPYKKGKWLRVKASNKLGNYSLEKKENIHEELNWFTYEKKYSTFNPKEKLDFCSVTTLPIYNPTLTTDHADSLIRVILNTQPETKTWFIKQQTSSISIIERCIYKLQKSVRL